MTPIQNVPQSACPTPALLGSEREWRCQEVDAPLLEHWQASVEDVQEQEQQDQQREQQTERHQALKDQAGPVGARLAEALVDCAGGDGR